MLNFGNYNKATTNGSNLNSTQFGLSQNTGGAQFQTTGSSALPSSQVAAPTVPGMGGQQGGGGFWGQGGGASTILGGIQTLGNLWNAYQQHKMAKEQMSFAREQWDTNLENQTQTYNTALEDRIRARHFTEGKGSGETDNYLKEHSL